MFHFAAFVPAAVIYSNNNGRISQDYIGCHTYFPRAVGLGLVGMRSEPRKLVAQMTRGSPTHINSQRWPSVALPGMCSDANVLQIGLAGVTDMTTLATDAADGQDFIVFDGECVLCSGFFRFMVARDKAQRFKFATAQSPLGQRLYSHLGLPTRDFETNLVVTDGVVHQRLDAFAAAMRKLPGFWWVLSICRFLPRIIKDPLYYVIARNRYAVFGRSPTCMIPDKTLQARFLPEGF